MPGIEAINTPAANSANPGVKAKPGENTADQGGALEARKGWLLASETLTAKQGHSKCLHEDIEEEGRKRIREERELMQ